MKPTADPHGKGKAWVRRDRVRSSHLSFVARSGRGSTLGTRRTRGDNPVVNIRAGARPFSYEFLVLWSQPPGHPGPPLEGNPILSSRGDGTPSGSPLRPISGIHQRTFGRDGVAFWTSIRSTPLGSAIEGSTNGVDVSPRTLSLLHVAEANFDRTAES